MPQSTSGNNYILTLVDFFPKWPEAVPIRSKNAEDVAVALCQIFLNMGFPSVISSDQGREFVNMLMDKLSEKLKFVQRISSAYHPQTNGLVERFNQALKKMLIKMTSSENQDTWDDYIKKTLFAYRTQIQKSLKKTHLRLCLDENTREKTTVFSVIRSKNPLNI